MPSVIVRSVSEEEHLTLSFEYGGKQRSMKRVKLELLQKTIQRIGLSLVDKKKSKKAKGNDKEYLLKNNEVKVELLCAGEQVEEHVSNAEAWKDGRILKIGDLDYTVELNPPTVTVLSIPNSFMAGFPVFPVVEVEFGEKHLCQFQWFKALQQMPDTVKGSSASPVVEEVDNTQSQWQKVGSDFIYTPTVEEVGYYLKLECIPSSSQSKGHLRQVTSVATVSAGPGLCPFDQRHLYTNCRLEGSGAFRVVSYNILADTYATGEFAEKYLYPYCPKYALDIQYRRQLLLKEIMGYNADIICLQECGRTVYKQMLSPALEMLGFSGLLQCKSGEVPEGEAIFFRKSKFLLVQQHNVVYSNALVKEPLHEMIFEKVSNSKSLLNTLLRRGQIGQVTILKSVERPGQYLCVANTHLYYKPYSPHIRLIQSAILLSHVEHVVKQYKNQGAKFVGLTDVVQNMEDKARQVNPDSSNETVAKPSHGVAKHLGSDYGNCEHMAVLFCGDFNSNPSAAVKQLFTEGKVEPTHPDWTVCEEKDQHCTTLELINKFNLCSACDNVPFTNYTTGYKGMLDYIFCDADYLEVESVIPVPEASELDIHVALPSVVMPSDHLALICDLSWKNNAQQEQDM